MRRRLAGPARTNSVFGRTTLSALSALCVLGLAACGTERAEDKGASARAEGRVAASPASPATPAATPASAPSSEETEGADFLPFMELLLDIAEPCLPSDLPTAPPPEELAEQEKVEARELGATVPPEEPLPVPVPDDAVPTSEPRDPEDARKETELSSVEKCEAPLHVDRITKALEKTPDPTATQVTKALHDLGYIAERVHTPPRAAGHVEFTLDLRVMDGRLCLSGSTTGTRTTIEAYGGSPEVECQDVRRTS
ncbi:hypothetical protein ACWD3I_00825 [Streptomyces sp. NPDC002817]|uniref:hypothetical protein n=1 Tax=Streptomyces sp. NPDC088357 TaxID=3154655 RepID=UPI00342131DB